MALYDKAKNWWDNIDTGMNVFGAGLSRNDEMMRDAGLLKPEDIKRAKDQSIVQGLLSAGLAYAIQPKNKGYGSPIPYLAKAMQSGLAGSRAPFEKLQGNAEMRQKIEAYKTQEQMKKDKANLFVTTPASSNTINVPSDIPQGSPLMSPDGLTQLGPNYGTQSKTTVTPESTELDLDALSKFSIKYPGEAKGIWDNYKTQAEVGALQNPESFRPATEEEVIANGGDPERGGQINTRTGKFSQSGGYSNFDTTERQSVMGTVIADYNNIMDMSDAAQENLMNYTLAFNLVDKIGATGGGTEALRQLDKVFISLGIQPQSYTEEQIASGEMFESIGNKLAIAQRPAASGVMTDNDFRVFQTMVNSLGKTPEANRNILKMLQLISSRSSLLSQRAMAYRHGMTSKLKDEKGNFIAKKPQSLDEGLRILKREFKQETHDLMMQMFPNQMSQMEGADDIVSIKKT